jgi:hypothetical protein
VADANSGHHYRVAHTYIDRGNPHKPGDEFSGWLSIHGKTIGMTGGIRPRQYETSIGTRLPAYIVLVTTHVSADYINPWDDVIDERAGVIHYWGDAKFSDRGKMCDDFTGNRCLKSVYDQVLVGDRTVIPPILHFAGQKADFKRRFEHGTGSDEEEKRNSAVGRRGEPAASGRYPAESAQTRPAGGYLVGSEEVGLADRVPADGAGRKARGRKKDLAGHLVLAQKKKEDWNMTVRWIRVITGRAESFSMVFVHSTKWI